MDPASYYKALVGEEFTGKLLRDFFNREDDTSVSWAKINIDSMPHTMEAGLQAIINNFEGKIWKGFHNGIIYVNPDDHHDWKAIMSAGTFRIEAYKKLDFQWRPKEPEKYTSQQGYCFILSPVM